MSDQLSMFEEAMSPDSDAYTGSRVAPFGISPSTAPDGETAKYGQVPARALPLAQRAKGKGLQTLVTSGLSGIPSSASANLQSSLENKLAQRLDTAGSTLFVQTWKRKATPLRRRYWEHTASGRRTSGSGFTSWRTPTALSENSQRGRGMDPAVRKAGGHTINLQDEVTLATWTTPQAHDVTGRSKGQKELHGTKHGCADLPSDPQLAAWRTPTEGDSIRGVHPEPDVKAGQHSLNTEASLATWATPRAEDAESAGMRHSRGTADTLTAQSSLCGWASPSARDWKDTPGMAETGTNPDGSERMRLDQLPRQANLAGWPTPMAGTPAQKGYNEAGNTDSSRKTVELASWPTPNTEDCKRDDWTETALKEAVDLKTAPPSTSQRLRSFAQLSGPVRLTASGEMLTGSAAAMESSGQLNPNMSLWLMGIPPVWALFGRRAVEALKAKKRRK